MKKKIIILILAIIGFIGLSSCDSLIYTTPIYYDYPPTVIIRSTPPPPPPVYRNPNYHRPHTPPPPPRPPRKGRH